MSDKLTTLQAFGNPNEAEMARGLIESHGIPVFLADEHIMRMGAPLPIGGVKLQVRASDYQEAREILEDAFSNASADEPEETLGRHSCPVCGGERSEPTADPVRFTLGLALLGIPLLFLGRKCRCQICGNVWRR